MKERPILFSAPMVRAILEGRKTQTRRVFKVRGPMGDLCQIDSPDETIIRMDDGTFHYMSTGGISGPYPCPYGAPGDLLWVRETWAQVWQRKDGQCFTTCDPNKTYVGSWYEYAATSEDPPPTWRPSIHMPRKASRLTLKITDVRVERLKDIGDKDAIAEGLYVHDGTYDWDKERLKESGWVSPAGAYWDLWEHINGNGSVDANPWVWVVTFERFKP